MAPAAPRGFLLLLLLLVSGAPLARALRQPIGAMDHRPMQKVKGAKKQLYGKPRDFVRARLCAPAREETRGQHSSAHPSTHPPRLQFNPHMGTAKHDTESRRLRNKLSTVRQGNTAHAHVHAEGASVSMRHPDFGKQRWSSDRSPSVKPHRPGRPMAGEILHEHIAANRNTGRRNRRRHYSSGPLGRAFTSG